MLMAMDERVSALSLMDVDMAMVIHHKDISDNPDHIIFSTTLINLKLVAPTSWMNSMTTRTPL
jgi:hypothetical protein